MGAGRKEKYRAWKLGGARAYTMAAKVDKFQGPETEEKEQGQERIK